MEFIRRFHDSGDLADVRELLRSKGIPTHVAPGGGRSPSFWALFCCINEQADDVRRLLHDPSHEPSLKVDAEAFEAMLEHTDTSLLTRYATVVATVVFVLFAFLVALLSMRYH
ncbi:hypothetical protein [Lysobacter soli]|uniref:Uncharacterized protein n=1 Tax=Lysobacter soli TaxID=453783 RepID=A0A3D8V9B2_9GAMM|nr:hypothetical protein [Lysobacter soli]RDY65986.1 hypothetical protein DX912_14900 [Lysobacter soli]